MKLRTLIASLILIGNGSSHALDLTATKLPIVYECRVTHIAGITLEESGEWVAGSIAAPSSGLTKVLLERFGKVTAASRKDTCALARAKAGYPFDDGFCLSMSVADSGFTGLEVTKFCQLFNAPWRKQKNSVLSCDDGSLVLDTELGVLLGGAGARGFLVGTAASLRKSDCKRIDR